LLALSWKREEAGVSRKSLPVKLLGAGGNLPALFLSLFLVGIAAMGTTNHTTSPMSSLSDSDVRLSERRVCPCLSVKAMHIGSCLFAGVMAGAVLGGFWGSIIGGTFGLVVGVAAAYSRAT
jgi:hypothetical protein